MKQRPRANSGLRPLGLQEPSLVITSELDGWASRWDRLVDVAPVPSPFLRSWWLRSAAASDRLWLLVARDELLLGGIALQQVRRLGVPHLQMMGTGPLCPDHLDLVALPGHEDGVVAVLRDWMSRRRQSIVDMPGTRAGSRLMDVLSGHFSSESHAESPFTPLPKALSDYPAGFRKTLRKTSGRLAAEGVRHRVRRGSSVAPSLDTLRKLHEAQWGDRSPFLPEFDRFVTACRRGSEFDEVAVHELHAAETVIATMVVFEVARRVSLYQGARMTDHRWRDSTSMLLHTVIADASDRGFTEVDFLRGDEAYKKNFAPHSRELVRLRSANGWAGRAALLAEAAARKAKSRLAH
jgi:hypothetical protein